MNERLKTLIPILLAVVGAAYALERRLAAIEKSVAVIEWRVDHQVGPAPWTKPNDRGGG